MSPRIGDEQLSSVTSFRTSDVLAGTAGFVGNPLLVTWVKH